MHIDVFGAGEPLVVLHGAPSHPPDLAEWAATLEWPGRVLVPHMPGYGATPALGPYSLDEVSARLERALLEHSVSAAHFIGWSAGAWRVLDLVRRGRISARSFLSIGGFCDLEPDHRTVLRGFAEALRGGADLLPAAAAGVVAPDASAFAKARAERAVRGCSTEVLVVELEAFADSASLASVAGIAALPILSVRGDLDQNVSRVESEGVARLSRAGRTKRSQASLTLPCSRPRSAWGA